MSDTLPKEQLLTKLLKMTTSSNDGEALTAIRKANELIKSAGWDWDRLIAAKIKVVANPFANVATPPTGSGVRTPPPTYGNPHGGFQPSPTPPPRPTPPPPPRPKPVIKTTWPIGINPNRFAAPCYCCGVEVVANAGLIFRPNQYHSLATPDWKVVCTTCNNTATVQQHPAARAKRSGRRANVSDLA
jgi:Protein of unknown function (DUF2786)